MYYITILDFTDARVYQFDLLNYYDPKVIAYWQHEDFEEFITDQGFSLSNIEWMSHSVKKVKKL